MKNKNNLKILVIINLLIMLSILIYISLPHLSYALNLDVNNNLNEVGEITSEHQDYKEMITTKIRQHYGYNIIRKEGGVSYVQMEYVENAANKLGILDIDTYVSKYLKPNSTDATYGWWYSLKNNTSIFCQQSGTGFPDLGDRFLQMFHAQDANTNDITAKGVAKEDRVEYFMNLADCDKTLEILWKDLTYNTIETEGEEVQENDLGFGIGEDSKMYQYTFVRVDYEASPRKFDTIESYIASYNSRADYYSDPTQIAMWAYKNGKETNDLFIAATAVENSLTKDKTVTLDDGSVVRIPVVPEMSVIEDSVTGASTGTVLSETTDASGTTTATYKVGPIKMNAYSYSWCEEAEPYSGKLICGIVEMTVELDNGDIITLDSLDDFSYQKQDSMYVDQVETITQTYIERTCIHDNNCNNCGQVLDGYETIIDEDGNEDLKPKYKDACVHDPNCDGNCSDYEEEIIEKVITYSVSPKEEDYIFPTPNSEFYIQLPLEDCEGATKIKEIKAVYKWTTADGEGGDLTGHYDKILWESQGISRITRQYTGMSDCTYDCQKCEHTGLEYKAYALGSEPEYADDVLSTYFNGSLYDGDATKIKHAYFCLTTGYCEHGHSKTHYGCHMGFENEYCNCDSDRYDNGLYYDWDSTDHQEYTGECDCDLDTDDDGIDDATCPYEDDGGHPEWVGAYVSHSHSSSCYCNPCPQDYCEDGFYQGKHYKENQKFGTYDESRDQCNGEATCPTHDHNWCTRLVWLSKDIYEDVGSQKLIYVKKAKVDQHTIECYLRDIPLVAKVEIFKYIYDVEHNEDVVPDGASDNSYVASDARRNLSEETKEANPVYVEADDFVTYKIIMKNSSAFGVKIRIDDILPDEDAYEFVNAIVGEKKLEKIEDLRSQIIIISANSEASVTVTIQVKALEGKHENIARIITRNGSPKNDDDDIDYIRTEDDNGPVVNHIGVQSNGTTETPLWESSDWFILNNYNTYIDKYLYKYDELVQNENNTNNFTDEDTVVDASDKITPSRVNTNLVTSTEPVKDDTSISDTYHTLGTNETNKANHPVNVEQRETVTYAIRVVNDATDVAKAEPTGKKTATQIKVTTVTDKLHNGLSYTDSIKATIFKKDDSVKVQNVLGVGCSLVGTDGQYNVYEITTSNTTILEPGEYIEFYMEAEVVQSNMYLYSMDNTAEITTISNINDVVIYDKPEEGDGGEDGEEGDDGVNRLVSEPQSSTEYVRQKDLVISGSVWVDINKDGLIGGETPITDDDKENYNINDKGMKEDVLVKLYRVPSQGEPTVIRTTRTNSDGLYTFARTEDDGDAGWRGTFNHLTQYSDPDGDAYQRVDKASGKDANGNYTAESQPYSYYVEFEYDGVIYKSTVYAGKSRLDNEDDENGYGSITDVKYYIDSNATELTADRETFNTKYEYISYNVAYGYTDNTYDLTASSDLSFEKQGHESYLNEDPSRAMTAKSFVNVEDQEIEYLWLYPLDSDNKIPETEYLKYINLGLELREDVDLALTKDVYNLKTTINGEEMEYDYNLGDTDGYLNDYVVKKPYGFEIYESDYKYRVEQYISEAVEAYKGANGEDELNIEITYRISLQNLTTRDDEVLAQTDAHKDNERIANNTQLNVKVHEVLDLYDENFIKDVSQVITVKVRDAEGYLEDKQITAGEAWMFMKKSEAGDKALLEGGETYSQRASNGGSKPIYVPDASGEYVKVKLDVSNESIFTDKTNDFTADGYTTAYISGMGDQVITEGGDSLDIYVKYVVDKDELKIDVDATYDETKTSTVKIYNEETKEIETLRIENNDVKTVITNVTEKEETTIEGEETTKYTATIARAIKLAEKTNTEFKAAAKGGRGTENIAQINAYSVWYTDGKPASLVDKDSNAGNIGITSSEDGTTSADNIEFYEDMTYKTGIELVAENTENTEEDLEEKYPGEKDENSIGIIGLIRPIRKIKGTIWDDSRTQILTENVDNDHQYIGDGYLDTTKTKLAEARSNENVRLNYKDESVTEDNDIAVRSAKAEFIEIIQVDDTHYYEEVLTHVTWPQVQNVRTDTNGAYTLNGFKPGRYIVRFTYGDTTENTEQYPNAKEDMLIFNGQDYKSTQYTGVSDSLETVKDADAIIKAIEVSGSNDARDDEVRRLEVNAYSEVMTNEIAEILKGLANDERELTPNSTPNTPAELQALTDNTYMTADTREFLVKAEKLTPSQTTSYTGKTIEELYYMALEAMKNEHIEARDFTINNVDLGIEYRPESQISLMKEIRQIKLTTEDNEVLVDLHFKTNEDGSERYHEIIKDESTGYELVQFITNNYATKPLINNIISEEYVQGLVYIQVDEELLQGCTIEITYGFEAQNSSEIDRVSKKLNAIRYRDNKATDDLIKAYGDKYGNPNDEANYKPELLLDLFNVTNTRYTASALSKAVVNLDTYKVDKAQEVLTEGEEPTTSEEDNKYIVYRTIPKTTTTNGEDGYFGRYVGHSYYTGKLLDKDNKSIGLDTIASLKFDKILDYIDTNLEYEQKTKAKDLTNRMWSKITSRELVSLVSHYKDYRQLLDVEGATAADFPVVTNIDGVEYKSMVVSIDDRNVDPGDDNDTGDVKNIELSKFLLPKVSVVGLDKNDDYGKELDEEGKIGYDDYTGSILLDTSKVLAAGSADDDKTYENMAEIVQFTTQTGRRTNFATTIGNADIHAIEEKLENKEPPFDGTTGSNSGSIEFITASIEPDTSATETITLIPPTGLMKNRRAIVSIMETAKTGVEVMSMTGLVVAIIAVVVIVVLFVIRKYKKRRIK